MRCVTKHSYPALLAALVLCAHADKPATAQPSQQTGPARIIDGDTLDIGRVRYRFFGVDAPEKKQICKDAAGKPYLCGIRSTEHLRGLIGGRPVTCIDLGPANAGRRFGRCSVGGVDLQAAMARSGHAVAYLRHGTDYVSEANAARSARVGMWAGSFTTPRDVRTCKRRSEKGAVGYGKTIAACS